MNNGNNNNQIDACKYAGNCPGEIEVGEKIVDLTGNYNDSDLLKMKCFNGNYESCRIYSKMDESEKIIQKNKELLEEKDRAVTRASEAVDIAEMVCKESGAIQHDEGLVYLDQDQTAVPNNSTSVSRNREGS